MQEPPNKEEFLAWREHPITKHFFDRLRVKREEVLEALAYRTTEQKLQDQHVGRVAAYTDILNVEFED